MITADEGILVEFCFVPCSESDMQALKKLPKTLAPESNFYGDTAYIDYTIEDDMKAANIIQLMIQRKSNSKRKNEPRIQFLKEQVRK